MTPGETKFGLAGKTFRLTLGLDNHLDRVLRAGDELETKPYLRETEPVGNHGPHRDTAGTNQIERRLKVGGAVGIGRSDGNVGAPEKLMQGQGKGHGGVSGGKEQNGAAGFHRR